MQTITPPSSIAFIGVGTMGAPMARHLIKTGFRVSVHDAFPGAREAFVHEDCKVALNAMDAARGAAAIITMLPTAKDVRQALFGPEGAVKGATKASIVLEMSTINAQESRIIARELDAAGLRMVDVPVARTPEHAHAGTLLAIAGGAKHDIAEVTPILDSFCEQVFHVGPQGAGIRLKLINNYMSLVGMLLAAEGLTLARKAGIDRAQALKLLALTPAGRGQLTTNFPRKVLAGDIKPDFPLRMGLKDLKLSLELGDELSCPLLLGASARTVYAQAFAWDRADQDCTAILHLIEDLSQADADLRDRSNLIERYDDLTHS
ncbi:NAD(P)-dependent oxidoreductase [Paracoccus aerius]|uniref:NAD-binding protein n=1 Tax=Paracoccus aerius TaxID=1915382 RepID=A0ABS1SAL1_9RHOB|nr:NAD(P)-binding domain-containing protein [Paracoccus aerius]MBL3675769.1 NAD-binding protein [Paracoccus aerius]GHG37069.1 3-sulfolactaldehyde reductase [Paracoccus aerius]